MNLTPKEIADGKAYVREERISILLDGSQREPADEEILTFLNEKMGALTDL